MTIATPAGGKRFELGEGVVWDARANRILWVDIERGEVFAAIGGRLDQPQLIASLPDPVGCVLPSEGGLLMATGNSVSRLGTDGTVEPGQPLFPPDGERRLNDGIRDADGRVIVGTLRRGFDEPTEQLLRIEHDGSVTVLRSEVRLANGLTFHPNGRLYHVDSWARTVSWCDYSSDATQWHTAFVVDGLPDGMCVDADGRLWIAMWGSGEVIRCTTEGTTLERVEVGTPFVTSCAFTGPRLDRLVITTAQEQEPSAAAGRIYAVSFGSRIRGWVGPLSG